MITRLKDPEELIRRVAELRGIPPENMAKKIGVDDGKGSLKVTLTVYDPKDLIPTGKHVIRATKEEYIIKKSKHKDTGANKVIILSVVNDVKESDQILRVIFAKAKLNSIAKTLIAGDLKVYNILLAMSNNASINLCGFCKTPINRL